jgi:hypothetical protein
VENTNLALAGAAFHHQQICTGRVALMRPFLIPASATGIRSHLKAAVMVCDRINWLKMLVMGFQVAYGTDAEIEIKKKEAAN